MESSNKFETPLKSNKRLPSNDEDLDEPECKKTANDKNLSEEENVENEESDEDFPGVTDIHPKMQLEEEEFDEEEIMAMDEDCEEEEEGLSGQEEVEEEDEEKEEEVPPKDEEEEMMQESSVSKNACKSETVMRCRSIRIGSYKVHPFRASHLHVVLSPTGISFYAPIVTNPSQVITIFLKTSDITRMLVHFGRCLPIVFVYTTAAFGETVRKALKMVEGGTPYFDPTSSDDPQEKITLLIDMINKDHRRFFHEVFPGDQKIKVIDHKTANEMLVKSTPQQPQDEELQANDPYINHFKCEVPESSAAEKLKFVSKKFEWENIGTYIYSKPQISISSSKEPSVENKIETFALKKNLYSTTQTLPLFNLEKSPSELSLFNLILNYFDVLYMKRTYQNGENLRLLYTLHVLNHVLKASARIIHHNSKLAKNPDEEYRDQGFTRTTCIILVPFRHDCHRIVSQLSTLLPEADVRNRKRFEDEYGSPPKSERIKKKPQDHEETFEGNTNEDFKIGLCIKNKSITLYSEFYKSDLIIASPLGLRQVIGAEGEKDRDFDFLSSVEILVIDRADVLFLQNSLHLLHVLKHMNLLPKESHGCNFFRVKMHALNGMAKFYRQTILLSSVENTWFETFVFQNQCFNYSGYLSSVTKVKTPAIQQILEPMKMCFRWFETSTLENEIDDRFNFFITRVLPDFKDNAMAQTLVYIPSYFDFVRLRNYFREMELSCVMICEYSKKGKIAQARDVFFKGYRHFMLYTERAHFYSRYHIKGIQHIIFYQLPLYPSFFHELCNSLMDSNPRRKFEEKSCTVLATKFELLQMKHIVGLAETKHMHNSKKKIFVKYTDK